MGKTRKLVEKWGKVSQWVKEELKKGSLKGAWEGSVINPGWLR